MPNPKSGTVTPNVGQAVKEVKAGKIDFRVDKNGTVHSAIGKASFDEKKLTENITAFINMIIKLKPSASKGAYIKGVYTFKHNGAGVRIDKSLPDLKTAVIKKFTHSKHLLAGIVITGE